MRRMRRAVWVAAMCALVFAGVLPSSADYAAYVSASSPVGWWGMNETGVATTTADLSGAYGAANNQAGVNLPMTYQGAGVGSLPDQAGFVLGTGNRSAYFDGTTDSGAYGNSPTAYNLSVSPPIYRYETGFSMEIWVKTDGLVATDSESFLATREYRLGFVANGGSSYGTLHFTTFAMQDYFSTASMPSDGAWHQVGVSWDGSTASFYIDGVFAGSQAGATGLRAALDPGANTVNLGHRNTDLQHFKGWVDEAVIWDHTRSAQDFADSYTAATGQTPTTTAETTTTSTVETTTTVETTSTTSTTASKIPYTYVYEPDSAPPNVPEELATPYMLNDGLIGTGWDATTQLYSKPPNYPYPTDKIPHVTLTLDPYVSLDKLIVWYTRFIDAGIGEPASVTVSDEFAHTVTTTFPAPGANGTFPQDVSVAGLQGTVLHLDFTSTREWLGLVEIQAIGVAAPTTTTVASTTTVTTTGETTTADTSTSSTTTAVTTTTTTAAMGGPALYTTLDNNEVTGPTVTPQIGPIGSVVGTLTTGVPGAIGEAFDFNQGRVDFGPISLGNSWTIAFWIRVTNTSATYVLQNQGGYQNAVLYSFVSDPGTVALWNQGWEGYSGAPIAVATDGTWTHVAWTYDYAATTLKSYLNGVPAGAPITTTITSHGDTTWRIGGCDYLPGSLVGGLDEVRLYGIALTDEEVAALVPAAGTTTTVTTTAETTTAETTTADTTTADTTTSSTTTTSTTTAPKPHSADYRTSPVIIVPNWKIDTTELNRVLVIWRNIDGYHNDAGQPDKFAAGLGDRTGGTHAADFRTSPVVIVPNWKIDTTELNRVLVIWRNINGYHVDPSQPDGYAAGL